MAKGTSAEPDCLGALHWAKLQSLEPEWIKMMLSHVFIGVTDFRRAFAFYSVIMDELGFPLKFTEPDKTWAGWRPAIAARPLLLIGRPYDGECASAGNGQMVALLAPTRAAVDSCYCGGDRERRSLRRRAWTATAIPSRLLRRLFP
ncbi:hypothetical protein [Methylosinus sp. Ce-a6]|uniref:hypothetical protein n=1 Tax=Methylosinus sp. Ce-a6 TaxID=2172005 RepID=UPI001FCE4BC1|nr:hypothetical protein [Methylosinus sp. Ce-a6]